MVFKYHSTRSKFVKCKFLSKSRKVLNLWSICPKIDLDIKSWNVNDKLVLSTSKLTDVKIS